MAKYLQKDCILLNGNDIPFQEISCVYPRLRPLCGDWEFGYDPVPIRDWMASRPYIPVIAVTIYGIFIVWGQAYFKNRKALNWRQAMAAWNLFLSVFSIIGLTHTLPYMIHNLATKSVRDNLCDDPESSFGSGSTGLWILFFVISKFPELFDTVFIVVHKKPLILLHWYHHITVLLYAWHSYVSSSPFGLFFAVMNYAVHAIMYGYYYLMAARMKPKWFNAMYITYAQIAQMAFGVAITLASFYYYLTDKGTGEDKCWIQKKNTTAASVMYGSYLLLFLQFFFERYSKGEKRRSEKKEK